MPFPTRPTAKFAGMKNLMQSVPVLITWDVDPTPEVTVENKKAALVRAASLLSDLRIAGTFFVHARIAPVLADEIRMLVANGHEIGCHGLTHGDEEEYSSMPESMQRSYLTEATAILRQTAERPIRSFRGPRVKTSAATQAILEELGYLCDGSVCSQRVDLVSSNLINPGWIAAPRLPYHPRRDNPFRRGGRRLWVIPVSAAVAPFISSLLYVAGTGFMKMLFRTLLCESRRTGKPIVYLIHPFEFAPFTEPRPAKELSWLRKIKTHGLSIRSRFYEKNHERRFAMNAELFRFMHSFADVRFMTVSRYVREVLAEPPGESEASCNR